MQCIKDLNSQFGSDAISFSEMEGGLTAVNIVNNSGRAKISLHGGHVMSFQPKDSEPVLWMSEKSYFAEWKPIRGGIPVCWPWFGAHPTDPDKPSHGFARLADWEVIEVACSAENETSVVLGLKDSDKTRELWDHSFELKLCVTVSEKLVVALQMHNTGESDFKITSALHTYFNISDIKTIAIKGFDGKAFIDTLDNSEHVQRGDITFQAETDLVMLDSDGPFYIDDPGMNRTIKIENSGSKTAVVWNPWTDKAKRMADYGDNEYSGMVCVETTNARTNEILVPANSTHTLSATLSLV